ncbi:ribosome biogenesis regulatory protein homolog [Athalia rosae]|uniref:ribosome biogenesis regulatory protein homolog n=1 Tax=Athalia rosae TaxID=37344 RepID=UPI0006260C9C|nr:ribosome biogenesis regulatory protein homolog [Athalia rosae]
MDIVSQVLEKATNQDRLKSTEVQKHLDVEIDEGSLLVVDYNSLDQQQVKNNHEDYIRQLTRDNVQLLINKVWVLPTKRIEEAIVATLPTPKFVLPRAQRIPKPKPLTKWQQFAKEKGIKSNKNRKPKLNWDEQLQKWIPNYGYKRTEAEKEKNWLVEVSDHADPTIDHLAAKRSEKVEKQGKNELQRLRNLARAKNIKVPRCGIPNSDYYYDTRQIATAVTVARSSTASVGKFQSRLPKEKDARNVKDMVPGSKKNKQPSFKPGEETKRNLAFVEKILSKRPASVLASPNVTTEVQSRESEGESRQRKKTKLGKKGFKKPKSGKGKRDPHTKVGGRKRRGRN